MLKENIPIASRAVKYFDRTIQNIGGYTGNGATNFLNNLVLILDIKEKNKLVG